MWSRKRAGQALLALAVLASAVVVPQSAARADTTGPFYIERHNPQGFTPMCIDDPGNSLANDKTMDIYECVNGARNEWWDVEDVPGGVWIVNVKSGKCLTVQGASKANNAWIYQYSCNYGTNEIWTWVPEPAGSNDPDGNWWSELQNVNSKKCITVRNNGGDNGDLLLQYTCGFGDNQLWVVLDT